MKTTDDRAVTTVQGRLFQVRVAATVAAVVVCF